MCELAKSNIVMFPNCYRAMELKIPKHISLKCDEFEYGFHFNVTNNLTKKTEKQDFYFNPDVEMRWKDPFKLKIVIEQLAKKVQ